MLHVYEFDSSIIPNEGNKDWFEVYSEDNILDPIYSSDSLDSVVKWCYDSGNNFEVNTLKAYYKEFGEQ